MSFNLLRRIGLDRPDEYALLQVAPQRQVIDRFENELDPGAVEFETGPLSAGRYVLREVRNGQFGPSCWVHDVGDVDRAGEVDALREELEELREAAAGNGELDAPFEFSGLKEFGRWSLMSDKQFMNDHGSLVVQWLFSEDTPDLGSPDVDLKVSSMTDYGLFKAIADPEGALDSLEAASERLGRSAVRGATGGLGEHHDHDGDHQHHGLDDLTEHLAQRERDVEAPVAFEDRPDQEPDEAAAVAVCDGCGREFEGQDEEHAQSRLDGHSGHCEGEEPESLEGAARELDRRREETGEVPDAEMAIEELQEAADDEEAADA